MQPKADLLLLSCFPVTYRTRWHLHPNGALTLKHRLSGWASLAAPLSQRTLSIHKGKGGSFELRGRTQLRFGLEDEGSRPGYWIHGHRRMLGAEFTTHDIARDGIKHTFSKCHLSLTPNSSYCPRHLNTVGSSDRSALQGICTMTHTARYRPACFVSS